MNIYGTTALGGAKRTLGKAPTSPKYPANETARAVGRCGMTVPAMDGTMRASYLMMMSPEPMIVQHDDLAIHRRRRWERTERSEPTSASRTGSNIRTDAIGDAVMIASGV
jgi:hypothetical protein